MRERLLEAPGVPEQINRDTVPVLINTTDSGFPDEIECLKWWKDQYYINPWTRMIYGHFMFINGDGSRYYGTSGCQCVESMKYDDSFKYGKQQFNKGVELFKKSRALERISKRTQAEEKGLQDIYKEIEYRVAAGRVCGEDMRLLTGRFLAGHGAQNWATVLQQLMPPKPGQNESDPLGPNMRISATRRLGEFVSDKTPFTVGAEKHLEALYIQAGHEQYLALRKKILKEKKVGYICPEDVPLPPSLVRSAAYSLGQIVGQGWKKDAPDLVEVASRWWLAHQGEARFQVKKH